MCIWGWGRLQWTISAVVEQDMIIKSDDANLYLLTWTDIHDILSEKNISRIEQRNGRAKTKMLPVVGYCQVVRQRILGFLP